MAHGLLSNVRRQLCVHAPGRIYFNTTAGVLYVSLNLCAFASCLFIENSENNIGFHTQRISSCVHLDRSQYAEKVYTNTQHTYKTNKIHISI